MPENVVLEGDCVEVMAGLDAESIDAIVTDPPYDLTDAGSLRLGPHPGGSASRRQSRGFMGKTWDGTGVAFDPATWAEALRVAKPGAHLLAFGGTRTFHRLACAIEDAGWEIRDCLVWGYASGFPKGLRPVPQMWDDAHRWLSSGSAPFAVQTSRSIRVLSGEGRAPIAVASAVILPAGEPALLMATGEGDDSSDLTVTLLSEWEAHEAATALSMTSPWRPTSAVRYDEVSTSTTGTTTRPITDSKISSYLIGLRTTGHTLTGLSTVTRPNGSSWPAVGADEGLTGDEARSNATPILTVLGPATWNPIVRWRGHNVALKPAWEPIVMARKPLRGTVAGNVERFGTGALNIDGTRIGTNGEEVPFFTTSGGVKFTLTDQPQHVRQAGTSSAGRWPANVLLTDAIFDGDTPGVVGGGSAKAGGGIIEGTHADIGYHGIGTWRDEWEGYGDSGTYSRFFLIPKAARSDREPVLGGLPERVAHSIASLRDFGAEDGNPRKPDNGHVTTRANVHPTVKPTELMRHLVRLVTPPGGIVLDCFAGSGSTLIAAEQEGFRWLGVEREPEYVAIANARLNGTQRGMGLDVPAPVTPRKKMPPHVGPGTPWVQWASARRDGEEAG